MSVSTARENAVLDVLARKPGTVGEVMAALDGNGMAVSPHAVGDILASLVRRGLAARSGLAYRITPAGQDAVRRRRAAYPAARNLIARDLPVPLPWSSWH